MSWYKSTYQNSQLEIMLVHTDIRNCHQSQNVLVHIIFMTYTSELYRRYIEGTLLVHLQIG